jgi:hypothetical protein
MPAYLITTCTNRKRAQVPSNLDMRHLDKVDQSSLLSNWTSSIRSSTDLHSTLSTYCGRGFQEAVHTSNLLQSELLVISAGLGLVSGEDEIPAYNATLVKSSPASIQRKIDGVFDSSKWWLDLNRINGRLSLISKFVADHSQDLVIITLSKHYIDLVKNDLELLGPVDIGRIRIIGPSSADHLPTALQRCFMPYDDRFDGPKGPRRGTRSDFPQRATRHFVEVILSSAPRSNCEAHSKLVRDFLAPLPRPKTVQRRKLTDEEVIEVIRESWHEASGYSARMLRLLRDEKNIACEQGRFARLFNQVKSKRIIE